MVCYQEENAEITLVFEKEQVKLERCGDYELSLLLKQGEISDGKIGFGGSLGDIRVKANKVSYSIGKDSLLASLHYDLIFAKEKQEMKLRVHVKAV